MAGPGGVGSEVPIANGSQPIGIWGFSLLLSAYLCTLPSGVETSGKAKFMGDLWSVKLDDVSGPGNCLQGYHKPIKFLQIWKEFYQFEVVVKC